MFRCHSLVWVGLVWLSIFSYTLMTHFDVQHTPKTISLVSAVVITIFGALILVHQNVVKYTKTLLWFCSWFIAVLVGVIFLCEGYISDLTLNIWVTLVSIIASVFWCVVSHVEKITEPGLHWYVWSMFTIVVLSSVFNNTTAQAIGVYIMNCALLTTFNVMYLVHICTYQAQNRRRCRQITRVCTCFVTSTVLLLGSIVQKTQTISNHTWTEYILATQVILLFAFVIDGIIGFSQKDYKPIADVPHEDV